MKHNARTSLAAGLALLLLLGSCANGAPESASSSPSEAGLTASASSGGSQADAAEEEPEEGPPSGQSEEEPAEAPGNAPAEAIADEEEPAAPTPEERLALAMGYIGKPVADLIAVIGEPDDKDYAPSCMGPGEDGNLYYDGFTVYTYLEDGEETIQDVE